MTKKHRVVAVVVVLICIQLVAYGLLVINPPTIVNPDYVEPTVFNLFPHIGRNPPPAPTPHLSPTIVDREALDTRKSFYQTTLIATFAVGLLVVLTMKEEDRSA